MGKVELMQEIIAEQRKLPNDIKDKLNKVTFINLVISIVLMTYMIVVNLLFINEPIEIFVNCTRASAITFVILDVILLEISYRKDSMQIAIHAIELLCVSLLVLSIPYIYLYIKPVIRNIIMMVPVFFSIYYVGKSIVIHVIETNKYRNNLSDVPEILKYDTENQSYIDNVKIEENSSVNVDEDEIIKGVNDIQKKINEEKEIIKNAKKNNTIQRENDDD